jgi:hypothetical protein
LRTTDHDLKQTGQGCQQGHWKQDITARDRASAHREQGAKQLNLSIIVLFFSCCRVIAWFAEAQKEKSSERIFNPEEDITLKVGHA